MRPTIALAIPHAAWIPERAAMMAKLRASLSWEEEYGGTFGFDLPVEEAPRAYREFTEREHWSSWALGMWRWALTTGASHFLTLQDDVEVPEHFWASLHAMLGAWPVDVVSLAATHSLGPEVARQGRRSYLTSKIVGWGWVMPVELLENLVAWCDDGNLEKFRHARPTDGEDTLVATFLQEQGITPRCPCPTIVDHLFVASTNEGFDDHTHRRSTVTWRAYSEEDMAASSWWKTTASHLPADDWRRCSFCLEQPETYRSPKTSVAICRGCLGMLTLNAMGLRIGAPKETP